MSLRIALVGASGYVGGELLRLLLAHPDVEITTLTAGESAGTTVAEHHPHLLPLADRVIEETEVARLIGHDVVFLALPHGQSAPIAKALQEQDPRAVLIDCGADFRLADAEAWRHWYKSEHPGVWPYGLPELPGQRDRLRRSRTFAIPGCYPTAVALALVPAFGAGLVTDEAVIVAFSGTSGAGKSPLPHLLGSEVMGAASPYAVGVHRHTPEIAQSLETACGGPVRVSITPVLAPMPRGILAVCTAPFAGPALEDAELRKVYAAAYDTEPFVHLLPAGIWPTTSSTLGANTAHLQVVADGHSGRLVAIAAIDNLTKGTAGSAIQCMNLALGIPEGTGLPLTGVAP
ncbi:MAG TPA: N-acetyl-gamma-glutamyl-phosphate reductase [Actinophytocola sp.]|uniref:N-acetyl-gamma-glutamyl-phosphate reductase n=1 Tax=Actinophytocola sp. TaxID=1872138 RepID=UPI002DDD2409|nr:N-acetyl-gamma-glutamyl-phosphate reductase [Actinophytocola sp.]HEV2780514.1 N-acetyl-gamma-glutamyl-phosphate reductase [Actinophytocola sp.]